MTERVEDARVARRGSDDGKRIGHRRTKAEPLGLRFTQLRQQRARTFEEKTRAIVVCRSFEAGEFDGTCDTQTLLTAAWSIYTYKTEFDGASHHSGMT